VVINEYTEVKLATTHSEVICKLIQVDHCWHLQYYSFTPHLISSLLARRLIFVNNFLVYLLIIIGSSHQYFFLFTFFALFAPNVFITW